MSQNTSVSLGEHYVEFIARKVKSGQYSTTSDVIRTGLRLLEEKDAEHEAKINYVRQLLIDAENSGPPQAFDFESFRKRKRAELENKSQ